jgi:prepilin-type N-terminal cleavage/methylation domain-containing protein
MKQPRIQSGFTLIETLVAIAILMVAIAGPLDIAEKGLIAADNSRDQTIAAYLAEDMMEYVKNIRDGNILAGNTSGTSWLAMNPSTCESGSFCIAETATGDFVNPSISQVNDCTATAVANDCRLYVTSAGYYTYVQTSGNQPTPFYRTFTITTPSGLTGNDANNIRLLTVRVYWTYGNLQYTYVLQSMIFNTQR